MIKLLLPILFFISFSTFAQNEVMLKGQIRNDVSDKNFISVINLTLKRGTITDKNGSFQIPAQANDILDISALQFKNKKFIVTEKMVEQKIIFIELERETTILPEITITTSGLSGNLAQDASDVEKPATIDTEYLGELRRIPTPAERRLYTATTRGENLVDGRNDARFDIPLNAVFNAVSGRTKKIKTLIDQKRALNQVVALENKFSPSFFTEALEIEVSKIEDFLFYAQAVNETVYNYEKQNNLDLVNALIKEAASYKALSNQPIEKE